MIEIVGLDAGKEERSWRVTWPEPDGSKGSSEFQTCELAVEFALLIRITMHINAGRRHEVVVLDEYEQSLPWPKNDTCPMGKFGKQCGTQRRV